MKDNVIDILKNGRVLFESKGDGSVVLFQFRKDGKGNYISANKPSKMLCEMLLKRDLLTEDDIEKIRTIFQNVEIVPLSSID